MEDPHVPGPDEVDLGGQPDTRDVPTTPQIPLTTIDEWQAEISRCGRKVIAACMKGNEEDFERACLILRETYRQALMAFSSKGYEFLRSDRDQAERAMRTLSVQFGSAPQARQDSQAAQSPDAGAGRQETLPVARSFWRKIMALFGGS